jgi:proline iminopeptidase
MNQIEQEIQMTQFFSISGRMLLSVLALFVSLGLAIFVFYGLVGFVNQLSLLTAVTALLLLLVSGGFLWLLSHRWWVTGLVAGGWLGLTAVLLIRFFPAVNAPYREPAPLPNMQFWELPTGSRIAYTRVAAEGQAQPTPIVFLHGGPGWVILPGDVAFYSQLAQVGFDVYLYDQIGSGRSGRLTDLRQYNTSRHVADLEAIRQQIGAARLILIGQSWGNTLLADYMAAYPEHVAKAIFSSPGAIWDVGRFKVNYAGTAEIASTGASLPPLRVLASVLLVARNPALVQQIVPERDLISFFNTLPGKNQLSQNYCRGDETKVPDIEIIGTNQYVNRLTFASQESYPDPRPALRQNQTPALIMRGECEFLPWEVAYEYQETLPNATLLSIPHAGHALYGAQPELVLSVIEAFLLERPLPLPAYTNSQPPARP